MRQAVIIVIQCCNPTGAQKPTAVEGNTMHLRSAVYQSLQPTTEDRQSWGCGRMYPDYTAPSRQKKAAVLLCLQQQRAIQYIVTTRTLLSPFAYLCTRPPPRTSLLFGQRCRDCFWYSTVCTWYVVADPILTVVCDEEREVHYFCSRQQQSV